MLQLLLLSCLFISHISAATCNWQEDGVIEVLFELNGVQLAKTMIEAAPHKKWGRVVSEIKDYAQRNQLCTSTSILGFRNNEAAEDDLPLTDDETDGRSLQNDCNINVCGGGDAYPTIYVTIPAPKIVASAPSTIIHHDQIQWHMTHYTQFLATRLPEIIQFQRQVLEVEFFYTIYDDEGRVQITTNSVDYRDTYHPTLSITMQANLIQVSGVQIQLDTPLYLFADNHIYLRDDGEVLEVIVNHKTYRAGGGIFRLHHPDHSWFHSNTTRDECDIQYNVRVACTNRHRIEPEEFPVISQFSIKQTGDRI